MYGQQWDRLFRALDKDHSGKISLAELTQAVRHELRIGSDEVPSWIIVIKPTCRIMIVVITVSVPMRYQLDHHYHHRYCSCIGSDEALAALALSNLPVELQA